MVTLAIPGGRWRGVLRLLVALIILILLLSPLLGDLIGMRRLLDLFFTGILISAAFATGDRKSQPIIASLLALPILASFWASLLFPWPGLTVVGLLRSDRQEWRVDN